MHGGSPLRSAPGADRSGHGDAEPAGSSHRPSRVFNVYIYVALACLLVLARSPAILVTAFSSRSRRLVRLARTKSETAPSTLPLKALAVRKT